MSDINWKQTAINLTGLALQGMLERENTGVSKIISDVLYKQLAEHAVSIAIACTDRLKEEFESNKEKWKG